MGLNAVLRWNSWLLPPIGILFNFTLLMIILRRTPHEMWAHCRVLLINPIFGILLYTFSIIGIPTWTITTIDGNGLVLINGYLAGTASAFLNASPMSIWTLFLYWHFFFLSNELAIVGQFVARYLILIRGMQLKLRYYLLFIIIILAISFFTCRNGNLMVSSELPKQDAAGLSGLLLEFDQTIYGIYFLNQKELIFGSARYRNKSIQVSTDDSILGLYTWICNNILLLYCGRLVFCADEAKNGLQKQLNKTMLLCTYCQLLFQAMFLILYVTSLIIPLDNFALFWSIIICWLPLFTPLACLMSFPPYRKALIGPFKNATRRIFIQQYSNSNR